MMTGQDFGDHPLAGNLLSWFTRHGGQISPDVQLVYNDSHGFHMRAKRPLTSPVVVSCPLSLTLSSLNLDPEQKEVIPIDSPLQQCRGKIPDHILTYLLLIEQQQKGESSPWHPYIACLPGPENMGTPLWFAEDDMAFLTGTSLAPAARERKEETRKQWTQAVAVLEELKIPLADEIDVESLLWAATIFTSRAFISTHILPERETIPILFPVVDILNHSVTAKVEWDFQPHKAFALKLLEGEHFQPGQELFNNYAPKQNDELLLGYGFCLEDNPIEQFALKLAFPSSFQEWAKWMGLLDASGVPFGMSSAFLKTDPNTEQHFLRMQSHPFGRYENHIPFFRGIPPFIVHYFFMDTVMALDVDIQKIDIERPGDRVTTRILVLLYQAIEQRCQSLPLHTQLEPQNDKQKYAKTYRDGQAKIIHSICRELGAVIDKLRTPSNPTTPLTPRLLSTSDCLSALDTAFPKQAKRFRKALTKLQRDNPQDEDMIWAFILVAFVALTLTSNPPDDSEISVWLRTLFTYRPLPSWDQGTEDADMFNFVEDNFDSFVKLKSGVQDASSLDVLDEMGLGFGEQPGKSKIAGFVEEKNEYLGLRLVMWALVVVKFELVPVVEEEGVVQKCLFVGGGEGWMYEDGGGLGQEIES